MEIREAKYLTSSPSYEKCPSPDRTEIAFIGRSNVGKSSLINMLCNNNKLAKTSATPGKTQLINHFDIRVDDGKKQKSWYLVDLPGYGFAKTAQRTRRRWEQMIEGYIRKRSNLANLFVLIDSRHAPQKIDIEFVNRLGKWQKPFSLVFTKSDKNKPQTTERNVNFFMETLKETWLEPPPFFISSVITKQGKSEIMEYLDSLDH